MSRRYPTASSRYTSGTALFAARGYVASSLTAYGRSLAKHQARVCLRLNNLPAAVFWTQVALFINRITKVKGV